MGFIKNRYEVKKPVKAFLFLMYELGYAQPQAQRIICTKRFFVNDELFERSGELVSGLIDVVEFVPETKGLKPLFTMPDFGVFEKPSGILVHPKTHKTPYSLLDEARFMYGKNANVVHRIDMETSGLLLVSRDKISEKRLKMMFEQRGVKKSYKAWVRGKIDSSFSVNVPLRQNNDFSTIRLKTIVHPEGKHAYTSFKPISYDSELDATLIEAFPHTGRQHQIRVHLFHVKHPIIGDPIYGIPTEVAIRYLDGELSEEERLYYMGAKRLLLHAQTLNFDYCGNKYFFNSRKNFFDMKKMIVSPASRNEAVYL